MFNIRNIKQAGGRVGNKSRAKYQDGNSYFPNTVTEELFNTGVGKDFTTPGVNMDPNSTGTIPLVEGTTTPPFDQYTYPGDFKLMGKGKTFHPGVKKAQEDFLAIQNRLRTNNDEVGLLSALKAKYPQELVEELKNYNLVGSNDGLLGPYTSAMLDKFGPILYDYATFHGTNPAEDYRQTEWIDDSEFMNSGNNQTLTGNVVTTDPNLAVTTDPNLAVTSPNAGHIRYITNGQWGNSYNPASHVQYQTYNPNAQSGNYYQYNNPALLSMNTGNSNYNVNLPNRGVGYNNMVQVNPAKSRFNLRGVKNLFIPNVGPEFIQERADRLGKTRQHIANSRQDLRNVKYDTRTDTIHARLQDKASDINDRVNRAEVMRAANEQLRRGQLSNEEYRDLRKSLRDETLLLDKSATDLANLDLVNKGDVIQQNYLDNQLPNVVPGDYASNAAKRRLLNRTRRFKQEGGITRPKFQFSGRTNPNYFQSQFGSGYTNTSLQSLATKPFDPNYQLPNYRFDSDSATSDALDVDRHLYPEGDQFAQMALSSDYKDQMNDVMSGNIFRNYDEQRRPSKYQFHGSYANTPTDTLPNNTDMVDINKRNTRALGFDQSGLTWGDKLQIMGNYTPALYNIAHSFIKPYPTMPAYNKYRYQVYHDMARQQTPKDYSDIYAASNKGMRDLRSNSPNAQVERANRLALYNSTMEALGKQKTANFATDRQLALAATQQLGQIGEHELAADEKARLERIAHEEARDNIRAKGVGQFGAATGKYGEAYNHALENRMKWELLSEIYDKYGLDSYNSVINGLNTGEFTAEDLILFKNTGSIEEVRRAKQARDAQQTTTGTKTTTETTDAASTNNGMTATRTTTSTSIND